MTYFIAGFAAALLLITVARWVAYVNQPRDLVIHGKRRAAHTSLSLYDAFREFYDACNNSSRCPKCKFIYKWDGKACAHCGHRDAL